MSEFKEHHVVPDVLDTWPGEVAHVEYDSKHHVNLGNELDVAHTQRHPKVHFPTQKGDYYTLLMLDPDALSRKTHEYRHYLHWLMVNIPGTGSDHIDVSTGRIISPYMGPAPPKGTGLHRYVIAVYNQHEYQVDITNIPRFEGEKRKSFNPNTFFKEHYKQSPELLAGNFFQAQHK